MRWFWHVQGRQVQCIEGLKVQEYRRKPIKHIEYSSVKRHDRQQCCREHGGKQG